MARVRLRLELPHDLPVSDEQVRAAVLSGLGRLQKSEREDDEDHGPRKHPSRYAQSLIGRSTKLYEERMSAMIDDIAEVLSR